MTALAGKKVLVAEDDNLQGRMLVQVLQKAGATVTLAANGKVAEDLLAKGAYDAFLSDWMMPQLDGIELARLLHSKPDRPFVVLVSALSVPEARAHALAAGADEFLAKPLTPAKTIDVLAQGIKRHARRGAPAKEEVPFTSDANHPVARTAAWKAVPETLRKVVGELLQATAVLAPIHSLPEEDTFSSVLPLVDADHLMEFHLRVGATPKGAAELARLMLGEPMDDEATLVDLVSEIANVGAGAVKTAFAADGFPFTLGIASRARMSWKNDYAIAGMHSLTIDSMTLSLACGVRPRNGVIVVASNLREGMVLAEDLRNDTGGLILPLGTRLTSSAVVRLQALLQNRRIGVCMPDRPE